MNTCTLILHLILVTPDSLRDDSDDDDEAAAANRFKVYSIKLLYRYLDIFILNSSLITILNRKQKVEVASRTT